jgi:hypothetical protein
MCLWETLAFLVFIKRTLMRFLCWCVGLWDKNYLKRRLDLLTYLLGHYDTVLTVSLIFITTNTMKVIFPEWYQMMWSRTQVSRQWREVQRNLSY